MAAIADRGPERFLNRELSWLAFNVRVLALAEDPDTPLLERAKFLAICSGNLDEFFQVRVAGLKAQLAAGVTAVSTDGRSPSEQLHEIHRETERMVRRQERLYRKDLAKALAAEGLRIVEWDSLEQRDRKRLRTLYEAQIQPALTPLAVDPAHPFPWISNLSLNLGLLVRDPANAEARFARVKVPPVLPRLIALPDGERWLPIEQLIGAHLDGLFPGMEIVSSDVFRVTRDAALLVDEGEADDLLSAIQSGLHRRLRVNDAVRLEIADGASDEVRELLVAELELGPGDVYAQRALVDLGCLMQLHACDRADLKEPSWQPVTGAALRNVDPEGHARSVFKVLAQRDIMVHHPYDSFTTSIEAFLEQAANDPAVIAIKHTLYRTAHRDNRVVRALIQAAKNGKEVVALIEIKARFDEESNIEWARNLEAAGVNVVYGIVGLKTHGKVVLVVRREGGGLRRYCHIGTGNYNPDTARLYEDIGILTASETIGADVGELFNNMTGYGDPGEPAELLVAPARLRGALLDLIREESEAADGQITIKINGLSDAGMIDALYAASCAGTRVSLLVRGICCLRPGVPGLSENIAVRSVVGRFLEHSRIYSFGSAARGARVYVGSADLMTRNLDDRIEVLAPVHDDGIRERIREILETSLDPRARAWDLAADGSWVPNRPPDAFDVQERFQELARSR